jgi:5-methylcytosine-specific restriction endonuclease McrA
MILKEIFTKEELIRSIRKKIQGLRSDDNNFILKKGWFSSSREIKPEILNALQEFEAKSESIRKEINKDEYNKIKIIRGELAFAEKLILDYTKKVNRYTREDSAEERKIEKHEKKIALEKKKAEILIAKEEKKKALEKKKNDQLKSIKNKLDEKIKSKRKTLKKIKPTLTHSGYCPYCFKTFQDDSDIHADHIYPLSKGGLESDNNLVLVCSSCNLKKGDLTLATFIKKYKLAREAIENELGLLNKDF